MRGRVRGVMGIAAALMMVLALCVPALADNYPHNAGMITEADACAACHRAHTAQAAKLLYAETSDQDDMCFTCHDGTSADTNVVDGVLVEGAGGGGDGPYGTDGAGLRGGGFVDAKMDTDHDGTLTSGNVTSTHNSSGNVEGTMWGSGPANSSTDYGITVSLACGDCHNPHGNGHYRILRGSPEGMEGSGSVVVADERDGGTDHIYYALEYGTGNYRDLTKYTDDPLGSTRLQDIGEWCALCHTRYWAEANSGHTPLGDAVFEYRHATGATVTGSCIQCHVAHGTPATMGTGYAGSVAYPDGEYQDDGTHHAGPAGAENQSRLLANDKRSVCVAPGCHTGLGDD